MLLAKRKLVIVLPPMLTVPLRSSRSSVIILSQKMLKRVSESRQPCLTPTMVLNQSPIFAIKVDCTRGIVVEVLYDSNQVGVIVIRKA